MGIKAIVRRNYGNDRADHIVAKKFIGKSLTKQAQKDECDVNKILAHYDKTGVLLNVNKNIARYMDTDVVSYQEAMMLVAEASSMFNELPSDIRSKFGNDTATFLDYANNPENSEELIGMGLLPKPKNWQSKTDAEKQATIDKGVADKKAKDDWLSKEMARDSRAKGEK